MFYREKKFVNDSQEAPYVGRVSFGLKDAASVGLTAGDVSLKLEKATIEDAGDYICYVSSDHGYDRASVSVIVTGECIGSGENTQNQEIHFILKSSPQLYNKCVLLLPERNGNPTAPVSSVGRR